MKEDLMNKKIIDEVLEQKEFVQPHPSLSARVIETVNNSELDTNSNNSVISLTFVYGFMLSALFLLNIVLITLTQKTIAKNDTKENQIEILKAEYGYSSSTIELLIKDAKYE